MPSALSHGEYARTAQGLRENCFEIFLLKWLLQNRSVSIFLAQA
jgi:hypothetical protein